MINNRAARHFVVKTTFHMGSGELPPMKWEDYCCYLGCKIGQDPWANTKEAREKYRKAVEKILGSQLTDWQKLDMMRRFVQPNVEYILRMMLPNHTWAKHLNDVVRGIAKNAFQLQWRTVVSLFYVPWKHEGLGLPNMESDLNIVWASQVCKFLISKDPKVMMMCARRLRDNMEARRIARFKVNLFLEFPHG